MVVGTSILIAGAFWSMLRSVPQQSLNSGAWERLLRSVSLQRGKTIADIPPVVEYFVTRENEKLWIQFSPFGLDGDVNIVLAFLPTKFRPQKFVANNADSAIDFSKIEDTAKRLGIENVPVLNSSGDAEYVEIAAVLNAIRH